MSLFKKGVFLRLGLGLALAVSGCNTVRGFGTDVQKGGHAIAKAAA